MKLIIENWRKYEQDLLTEGKILDALKNGFKKLIEIPKKFDQMVEQTKENFKANIGKSLESWAESPEMREAAKEIATNVASSYGQNLREVKESFTVDELRQMGVGPETIELIRTSSAQTVAETLISREEAVGKAAPPAIKDWLVRFVSKFIGSFVFGFIDNFIMVVAGSQIDAAIGGMVAAGANSALLAAGLGNTLSDAIGELASNSIESAMDKAGLDPQAVSDEEVASGPMWMRFMDKQASVIGIILGCLVGLFPLFLEEQQNETPT